MSITRVRKERGVERKERAGKKGRGEERTRVRRESKETKN
jgi:hypothetical protein